MLTAGKQMNSTDPTTAKIKNTHPMSAAWSCLPVFGFCGTLLNSFVLYIGYSERQTFIKPVNAMIWSVKHFKNSYTTLHEYFWKDGGFLPLVIIRFIRALDMEVLHHGQGCATLQLSVEQRWGMFLREYFLYLFVCCLYNSSHWGFTHQVIFFTERSFSLSHSSQVLVCQGQSQARGCRGFQVPSDSLCLSGSSSDVALLSHLSLLFTLQNNRWRFPFSLLSSL